MLPSPLPSRVVLALLVVAGAVACDGEVPPAEASPDAGEVPQDCHPILGPGCPDGWKCAFILQDPSTGIGRTGCARQGIAELGRPCVGAQLPGESDDCRSGGHCYEGRCTQMCMIDYATCSSATSCVGFERLDFDLCLAVCDPLAQDCPSADSGRPQGCYLTTSGPICAAVAGAGTGAAPGEACVYQNECGVMSGCFDDGLDGGVCLHYCDYDTYGPDEFQQLVNDPDNCQANEVCGPIADETTVGACRLPD